MSNPKKNNHNDFDKIALLIEEARNRAFHKVNEELVLLYFDVGNIVSQKVTVGAWGEGTVDELAKYISAKLPVLSGFNLRGIYRMKQFYETYSVEQFVSPMATLLKKTLDGKGSIVSAMPTQLIKLKSDDKKVSAMPTLSNDLILLHERFVTTMLNQSNCNNDFLFEFGME
jgi:hypothetical protein